MKPLVTNNPELKPHEPSLLSSTVLSFPLHTFFSPRFIITDQHPQYYNSSRSSKRIREIRRVQSRGRKRASFTFEWNQNVVLTFGRTDWKRASDLFWTLEISRIQPRKILPAAAMRNSIRKVMTPCSFLFFFPPPSSRPLLFVLLPFVVAPRYALLA